jgi:hypothetical protein
MVFQGKLVHPALYSEGLVTTICHEIAEMIGDPMVTSFSSPDSKGRKWLMELCDPVFGSYSFYSVNGQIAILPDFALPSFYDVHGKAPFSFFGGATAAFTMTPAGYGYYEGPSGLVRL